jgi:hypothetical protein
MTPQQEQQQEEHKDVTKNDIINVINKTIQRMQSIDMVLCTLIEYVEMSKNPEIEESFKDFMDKRMKSYQEKMKNKNKENKKNESNDGGKNELQSDDTTDGKGNNSDNNEDS